MILTAFSKSRLDDLHNVMSRYVTRKQMPGLVALVSRRGEVHVDAIGTLAFDSNAPMRHDTIFRIASISKPVTAVATMILVEECKLRLDDPVDHFLPELANRRVLKRIDGPLDDTVPANRSLTTRDLLTFRMGFGVFLAPPDSVPVLKAATDFHLDMSWPSPDSLPAPDEFLRRLGTLPLMHQPGEKWMYNTGADVLGVLITRVSGQPLETFLRERLFDPLGMKDTGFSVPTSKLDRFAACYRTNPETGVFELYDSPHGQWSHPPQFPAGASGMVSTIDDYFLFAQMIRNNGLAGNMRVLSPKSVELMTSDQLTFAQKALSGLVPDYFESHGWGFCMSVVTRQTDFMGSVGTYGWDGGLGTSWRNDPKEDLIGILMTQRAWTSPVPPDYCNDFWTSAYRAIED